MEEKVGVYICHCGTNIAGTVDVLEVAKWVSEQPHVEIAREYKFMCSSLGQELIENDIREYGLTHVVVGSCSPHMHEKTFRGACQRAGLNPFLFEMANIRELDSWITNDKVAATRNAKAMIKGAVERVILHQALDFLPVEINPEIRDANFESQVPRDHLQAQGGSAMAGRSGARWTSETKSAGRSTAAPRRGAPARRPRPARSARPAAARPGACRCGRSSPP